MSEISFIKTPPPIDSSMLPIQEGDGKPRLHRGKQTHTYGTAGALWMTAPSHEAAFPGYSASVASDMVPSYPFFHSTSIFIFQF